jgi:hypothetical protein
MRGLSRVERFVAVAQYQSFLAEGEGFVPGDPAPINDLRTFSIAQITRNAQNLSIRYKTSTAGKKLEAPSEHTTWPLQIPIFCVPRVFLFSAADTA